MRPLSTNGHDAAGAPAERPSARTEDAAECRTLVGHGLVARLGAELDELHAATGAPVTARRTWLQAWEDAHPSYEPFALLVAAGARLEAAALLARREERLLTQFVALGSGLSDQVRFPARTPAAARTLADAMLAHFAAHRRPWQLLVRHLPPDDPVARHVAAGLACARTSTGDPSPTLRFGAERTLRAHVSKNHHKQVRRMVNRMESEGLHPLIEHLREPAAITAVMPEVEDVCVRRDLELRGMSLLDRPSARDFLRRTILAHAARGEVELTTLRLAGALAAYVVCFLDYSEGGGAHRMWNCRLAPEWERYGVGRVANNAALERCLADPRATEFDWMRGAEPYKMSMCNHVEHALDLRAWSSPAVRLVVDSPRTLKDMVRGATENGWLRPALDASRRVKAAGRRGRRALGRALRGARD